MSLALRAIEMKGLGCAVLKEAALDRVLCTH